jgi:hypothetical protein
VARGRTWEELEAIEHDGRLLFKDTLKKRDARGRVVEKDKLGIAFQGEQLKLVEDLGKTYATAFKETQGDIKTKGAAALAAYRDKLDQAGKSQLDGADLQKQAATEMESAEKQVAVAMTKLEQTFSKPELLGAVTKLANMLPGLADGFEKLVTFATENPLGAAAGGVAALGAKGFAEGAIGAVIRGAFTSGATAAAPTLASAISGAGPGLAGAFGGALGPIGLALGAGVAAMVITAQRDAIKWEAERRGAGREAFSALDADRQKSTRRCGRAACRSTRSRTPRRRSRGARRKQGGGRRRRAGDRRRTPPPAGRDRRPDDVRARPRQAWHARHHPADGRGGDERRGAEPVDLVAGGRPPADDAGVAVPGAAPRAGVAGARGEPAGDRRWSRQCQRNRCAQTGVAAAVTADLARAIRRSPLSVWTRSLLE